MRISGFSAHANANSLGETLKIWHGGARGDSRFFNDLISGAPYKIEIETEISLFANSLLAVRELRLFSFLSPWSRKALLECNEMMCTPCVQGKEEESRLLTERSSEVVEH